MAAEDDPDVLEIDQSIKIKASGHELRKVDQNKARFQDFFQQMLDVSSDSDQERDYEEVQKLQAKMRSNVSNLAPKKRKTSVVILDALSSVTDSVDYSRVSRAHGEAFRSCVKQLLENIKSVEVCFLVDATNSMDKHINAVKTYIQMVVDHFKQQYRSGDFKMRLGFVGYRDWVDDVQFEVLDFTEDVEEFIQFVDGVEAYGGGDIHENVLWGMDKCINEMSWSRMSKLVIHILDAPPHGRQFGDYGDEDPDWFQHDYKDVQTLFYEMGNWSGHGPATNTPINYVMVDAMGTQLEETKKSFKAWYKAVGTQLKIPASGWWFDTVDMVDPEGLIQLMFRSITSAMAASVSRSVSSNLGRNGSSDLQKKLDEYEIDETPFNEVDWDVLPELEVDLHVYEPPEVTDPDTFAKKGIFMMPKPGECFIKMAESPFAEGEERFCFHGMQWHHVDTPESDKTPVVIKLQKDTIRGGVAMGCRKHAIVRGFINCFNKELREAGVVEYKLKIVSALHVRNGDEEYSMEPFIPGQFIRINNNLGLVMMQDDLEEWIELGQCFSFFTHILSEQKVLVADIQGWLQVKNTQNGETHTLLLTDPALHNLAKTGAYGVTDLGKDGIREFLKSYDWENNRFHQLLGLPPVVVQL